MPERAARVTSMWFILILVMALTGTGYSGIPPKINYQVRLVDSSAGEPLVGSQNMIFRIYDQASDGSMLWSESQTVTADSEGIASAILGSMVPLDISFDEAAWLEVEVDGEILLPRREVVSVPYAFRAENSDRAGDSDSLGGYGADAYLKSGEASVVTAAMIADGEITDDDISEGAAIDPGKIDGTAWTSTNDGAGSGLDADLLDGLDADAFADSGHAHDELYRRKEELQTTGTVNYSTNPVDWTKLKNVPGGFADGVDDAGGAGDGHSLDAADGSLVDVVYVSNQGNVGIGTTVPTLGKVEVLTASATGVYSATNSGIGILGWSSSGTGVTGVSTTGRAADFVGNVYVNGRLGIGTDSPTVSLDVEGAISADSVYMIRNQRILAVDPGSGAMAVGVGASAYIVSGSCTMVGHEAGYNNRFGANTFVGCRAGYDNTVGGDNTFVGAMAGEGGDSGGGCTFVGSYAGNLARGPSNTFVGSYAGKMSGLSSDNTFIGANAALSHESGSWNVFVGSSVGFRNVSGDRNVFLGYGAGHKELGSDKLYISNGVDTSSTLIYGDFTNGRIGLGTLSPERRLHIRGNNPRILIDAYASNPEINFKNAGDGPTHTWSVYKESGTDDLRFYRGGDKVTFDAATGNVGIGTSEPTSKLHVVGDIHCTGKLTSDGGNDPPYVLYDRETRQAIVERVDREVPPEKLDGAVLFWNGDESSFEVYLPSRGQFSDLMGNVLAEVSPAGEGG